MPSPYKGARGRMSGVTPQGSGGERDPVIALIAAMANNRVIGSDNRLPWKLPADLRYFKTVTTGKPVIMGRRTWESIGRALPHRTNIVVTRDPTFLAEGCLVVHSVGEALHAASGSEEIMVIGGASLYEQLLPCAQRLYLTLVDAEVSGDALFPKVDATQWQEVARDDHVPDAKNEYPYSFVVYERA